MACTRASSVGGLLVAVLVRNGVVSTYASHERFKAPLLTESGLQWTACWDFFVFLFISERSFDSIVVLWYGKCVRR